MATARNSAALVRKSLFLDPKINRYVAEACKEERRSWSSQVNVLLSEAIEQRQKLKAASNS